MIGRWGPPTIDSAHWFARLTERPKNGWANRRRDLIRGRIPLKTHQQRGIFADFQKFLDFFWQERRIYLQPARFVLESELFRLDRFSGAGRGLNVLLDDQQVEITAFGGFTLHNLYRGFTLCSIRR